MFSPNATYRSVKLTEASNELLLEALWRKIIELRWCYQEMTVEQERAVAKKITEAGWGL